MVPRTSSIFLSLVFSAKLFVRLQVALKELKVIVVADLSNGVACTPRKLIGVVAGLIIVRISFFGFLLNVSLLACYRSLVLSTVGFVGVTVITTVYHMVMESTSIVKTTKVELDDLITRLGQSVRAMHQRY